MVPVSKLSMIFHQESNYEITYRHRSATYRVRVENPAGPGCGVRSVTVDGRPAPDGSVPAAGRRVGA